jgi:hypothetical protein
MNDNKSKENNRGYVPIEKGYQPGKTDAQNGHKPEKAEFKPVNPPKKK